MSMRIECLKALSGAGLVALLAGSAFADTNKAEEIAALESQLQQARAEYAQEQRQEAINNLTAAAAADAANRSFYLGGPATVGYNGPGKGFGLSDEGGNNTLNVCAYTQFRFVYNHQNDDSMGRAFSVANPDYDPTDPFSSPTITEYRNVDGTSEGFEFARNRFIMSGRLFGEIDYKFLADFGSDGVFTLLDAYFDWDFEQDMTLRVGQMPTPFGWEFFGVGATNQLAVERSTVERLFGAGRTQGVALIYSGVENLTLIGGITDGANAVNTDWNDDMVDFALTGRADYVIYGDPAQFHSFTSDNSSDNGLRVGGAAHWQDGDVGDGATAGSGLKNGPDLFAWTVDAQAEFQGANLYGAIFGQHVSGEAGASDTDSYGYLAQGGFYFTDDMELFGRWEYFDIDGYSGDEPMLFTFGMNYYLNGQVNKLTADVGFATEEITPLFASDSRGIEVDADGEDGQIFLRFQWQLMI